MEKLSDLVIIRASLRDVVSELYLYSVLLDSKHKEIKEDRETNINRSLITWQIFTHNKTFQMLLNNQSSHKREFFMSFRQNKFNMLQLCEKESELR